MIQKRRLYISEKSVNVCDLQTSTYMLHTCFCKICTIVKLENENAVTLSHGCNVGVNSKDKRNKLTVMAELREEKDTCTSRSGAWESHQLCNSLRFCNNQTDMQQLILHSGVLIEYIYFAYRFTADDADIDLLSVKRCFNSSHGTVSHPPHRTLADNFMAVLQIIKSCHIGLLQRNCMKNPKTLM
jgi:hypothetical protein